MLKKIRFSILFISILLGVLVLSGCKEDEKASSTEQEQRSYDNIYQWGDSNFEKFVREKTEGTSLKIGFAPPAASEHYDIFIHGAYTMMNEISDRFGVSFEFEMAAPDDFSSVERQVATIENWTSLGFDAILVCSGGDFDSMNAVYEKARENGTEIYLFNYPAELWDEDELKATAAITYNNERQSGYQVGKYAAEKLEGKGNIVLIWGVPGYWATARKNGFLEAISEYPNMKIVAEQRGDYVRDKGMMAAENLLQSNPDIDLIYGENEEMALGAVQAVKSRGLKLWDGKEGIMVIGADGLNSGFDSIRQGELTATVDVGTVDMGRELIRSVFMHQSLGYSIDKIQNVPTVIVDKDNVDMRASYVDWALNTEPNY